MCTSSLHSHPVPAGLLAADILDEAFVPELLEDAVEAANGDWKA